MEQQTVLRSAAIIAVAIAASYYGAQHFLTRDAGDTAVSVLPAEGPDSRSLTVADAQMTAFSSDTPAASDGQIQPQTLGANGHDGAECTPSLTARPAIDALIEVTLDAPCHPNERLVVSHADLAFSAETSEAGRFTTFLPALAAEASIDLFLGDDTFLQAATKVEGLEEHFRVVVQWTGPAALGLHGFHGDAEFGSSGHLHAGNRFDSGVDAAFLVSLGTPYGPDAMLAEIYSIPAGLAGSGRAELQLDFSSTDCGQIITAYITEIGPDASSDVKPAAFSTPDCPAEPGTLVMQLPLLTSQHAAAANP